MAGGIIISMANDFLTMFNVRVRAWYSPAIIQGDIFVQISPAIYVQFDDETPVKVTDIPYDTINEAKVIYMVTAMELPDSSIEISYKKKGENNPVLTKKSGDRFVTITA